MSQGEVDHPLGRKRIEFDSVLEINIYCINPVLYDNAIVYNDIIKMVIIGTHTL